jgi:hypothetical protein
MTAHVVREARQKEYSAMTNPYGVVLDHASLELLVGDVARCRSLRQNCRGSFECTSIED